MEANNAEGRFAAKPRPRPRPGAVLRAAERRLPAAASQCHFGLIFCTELLPTVAANLVLCSPPQEVCSSVGVVRAAVL